ncbi:trypsin-like peptidase domain-containing protein [Streptomyces sp. TRM 70361]|uniref:S1C family serine protease n=1 Tax=Streptomyces sp. TRM 70361 TaxID=3116553 RepID=UPI002E7BCF18|nr:trypsin-like peptidase domain-containing protein [Streptomyces sp. TRM 70361]MEE1939202.1 trypsin-like peptidase domain-containing protein [Streptomyces sp. TRM 70361]
MTAVPRPGGSVRAPWDRTGSIGGIGTTTGDTARVRAGSGAGECGESMDEGKAAEAAPRPLHGEDPYGTPPYGGPGPWAPAPPVQHPVTPARGTPLPPRAQPPVPAPGAPPDPAFARYDPWAPPSAAQSATPPSGVPVPPGPASPSPGPREAPYGPHSGSPGPAAEPRRRRRRRIAAAAVLLALAAGSAGGVAGAYAERHGVLGLGTIELSQAPAEDTGRDPRSVAGIAERTLPGVVTIHVRGAGEQGTGTGFVLDERGHLLTNHHVVDPAGDGGDITVTFHDGQTAAAEVVGTDSGYDLAVLRVREVFGLHPLPLGNSDSVRVGDPVVAIGAPYELAGTVTAGIISARERPIVAGGGDGGDAGDAGDVSYVDALQTDAPINPGNSGGPLVDSEGRVIGINSAIRAAGGGSPESGPGGSIGLGFAIPVNQAKRVAEELINTGRATHPVIGVTLDMDYSGDGARITPEAKRGSEPVVPGGPADRAGVEAGDVITAVDGTPVHSGEELIVRIRSHRPGDRLELTVERGGAERSVSLVLGSATGP